ncbi:MAG: DUF3341 domain-containing protein [Planctomycetales bacterium]
MNDQQSSVAPGATPYGMMAIFDTPDQILEAARRTHDAGYRSFDCQTPFSVHGLDNAMGIRPTILPILVFLGGLTGAVAGLLLQWFTNASGFEAWLLVPIRGYEFLISGKPLMSGPAWIPVMFETTILFSAITTVVFMLLLNGLPRLYHPTLKSVHFARVTNDRFYLVIEARDANYSPSDTEEFMKSLKPSKIEVIDP